jgi:hypothetical protein
MWPAGTPIRTSLGEVRNSGAPLWAAVFARPGLARCRLREHQASGSCQRIPNAGKNRLFRIMRHSTEVGTGPGAESWCEQPSGHQSAVRTDVIWGNIVIYLWRLLGIFSATRSNELLVQRRLPAGAEELTREVRPSHRVQRRTAWEDYRPWHRWDRRSLRGGPHRP